MSLGQLLLEKINSKLESKQEDGMRSHLGASIIGRKCEREIFFMFRWAKRVKFKARMLRLFDRGHKEEDRFIEWLEDVCENVWALDPNTGEQIRISEFEGHFGGSLDGVIRNPAGIKGDFLAEFKTHNDKSFKKLVLNGVKESKPEHYTQMQVYLYYKSKLQGAFYFAINKNDDSLHIEYVERDEEHAKENMHKASRILKSEQPPEPFNGASEYNFYCDKFCDFTELCYKNAAPQKTCRSCQWWQLDKEGQTRCDLHKKQLTVQEQKEGCDKYERLF